MKRLYILNILLFAKEGLIRTFHTNILTKKNFVNSRHKNTNSKGDFALKTWFQTFALKISGIQKLF